MPPSLIQIRQYLEQQAQITPLLHQARRQEALLERVRRCLPEDLRQQCVAALAREDALILFASSPVWGSRLRFAAPGLLTSLGEHRALRVRVIPEAGTPAETPPVNRRISRETAALLLETANHLGDPALGATLRRLADLAT